MPAAVIAVCLSLLALQASQPLKKSDLIRLLSSSTIAATEVAELVRSHCLTFTPSARDKSDLRALGATDAVMRRIDECARKSSALTAKARARDALITAGGRTVVTVQVRRGDAVAKGVRLALRGSGRLTGGPDLEATTDDRGNVRFEVVSGAAAGTYQLSVATVSGDPLESNPSVELTVRPAPVVAAPSRTGFVSGTGQRGRVGTRLPLPLVFEARDVGNAPVIGQPVKLTADNAKVEGAGSATDSTGRVRAAVILGQRAGPVRVVATLGGIEREASLVALPGPPARLEVRCGTVAARGRLTLAAGATATVEVAATDAFGNGVPLTGLRVSVGDEDVVRASAAAGDSIMGRFSLRAGHAGATNLVVLGSGLRESIVATVATAGGAGGTACRAAAARD